MSSFNGNGKHATALAQPKFDGALLPPNNEDAELAVLGSILLDTDTAMMQVVPILTPEAFYHIQNRNVYAAMCALTVRHEPIDLLTVTQEMKRQGTIEPGTESFVSGLTNGMFSSLNVAAYAKSVADEFVRRRMLGAASATAKLAYDHTRPTDDCLADAGRALMEVQQDRNSGSTIHARKAVNSLFERIEFLHGRPDKNVPLGLSTGYTDWDKLTDGGQPGDLIIVAARPSMGKSALLKDLAVSACKNKKNVAFSSLETSNEQLMTRIVCTETGIDSTRIRKGDLRDDEWANFTKKSMEISDWGLWMFDDVGLTIPALRAKVNRIYQQHGLDLICVDYLGLLTANSENRVQEVSQISRGLKEIAREFNVPLYAAAQLSRQVEQRPDKRPQLSDLRDSGSLEQDADVVAFIYRDEYYNDNTDQKNIANINIAKNRNGPTGRVDLFFDKRLTAFKPLHRERIEI